MAQQIKSVPRPEPGAGVPTPKGEFLYLYFTDDIEKEPDIQLGKTAYTAEEFALKTGAKGIKFYATSGTIEPVIEKTGDTDSIGFTHGIKWAYPGAAADGVISLLANHSVVAFHQTCEGGISRKYGSKCCPLCFSEITYTDNKEANKREITFKGASPEKYLPIDISGDLPAVEEFEVESNAGGETA